MEPVDDEIEAVCSIWGGVKVEKLENERRITAKVRPLEDGMISASVLVEFRVFKGYPSINPEVKLTNPRGIGEPEFEELCRQVEEIVEENTEMPIICEIFQRCCDFLGEHQHNDMDCSICLLALSDKPITMTSCEHFMHSDCFIRYLNESARFIRREIHDAELPHLRKLVDRNVFCPVCREVLTEEDNDDFEEQISKIISNAKRNQKSLPNPKRRISTTKEDVVKTIRSWREQQLQLAELFKKQKEKGGIIDIEEDKKRRQFFIETGQNAPETSGSSEEIGEILENDV